MCTTEVPDALASTIAKRTDSAMSMTEGARARSDARRIKSAAIHAVLIALSIVFAFPLYWLIKTSLVSNGEAMKIPPSYWPHEFLWSNYAKAFTYGSEALGYIPFLVYGRNTLVIATLAVLGTVISNS